MKNQYSKTVFALLLIACIFSCKKEDDPAPGTNPGSSPVVSLIGSANITIDLNSIWIDPGATAQDYLGTSLTVTSNSDTTNPNTQIVGNYTIIYSATDSYGRTGTATRIVTVQLPIIDVTPPVVTLVGNNHIDVSLNSAALTDPGAFANDDHDGSVVVVSDFSSINPNLNFVGVYNITYTAVDSAGNIGTALRTIRVKNDAENFAGTYAVHDSVPGWTGDYIQVITVDNTINNRVHFSLFGDYANNTDIFATKDINGDLEIPLQTAVNIGSGAGSCDVSTHQFTTTSYIALANGFEIIYTDAITAPAPCIAAVSGVATYIKQ